VRAFAAHLEEISGVNVDCELISRVTDGVMDDLRAWAPKAAGRASTRHLSRRPAVLKIREGGGVQRPLTRQRPLRGIALDGCRDTAPWFRETNRGAKFWGQGHCELKPRRVADILVCFGGPHRSRARDRGHLPEHHRPKCPSLTSAATP
jgi:transposase-like protein